MDHATITVTMTHQQASALETAIADLPDMVKDAEQALMALGDVLAGRTLSGEDVAPMLSLFARALASVAHIEGKALREFDPLLRKGLSAHQEARRRAERGA